MSQKKELHIISKRSTWISEMSPDLGEVSIAVNIQASDIRIYDAKAYMQKKWLIPHEVAKEAGAILFYNLPTNNLPDFIASISAKHGRARPDSGIVILVKTFGVNVPIPNWPKVVIHNLYEHTKHPSLIQ